VKKAALVSAKDSTFELTHRGMVHYGSVASGGGSNTSSSDLRINRIGTAGVVNTSVLGVKSYDYRKIN